MHDVIHLAPQPAPAKLAKSLTAREYQVACMCDQPNKIIAWKLDIGLSMVKNHLAAAMLKTGTNNRTQLYAAVAISWQGKAA